MGPRGTQRTALGGFADDRQRLERRIGLSFMVAIVFVVALARVWLTTEVSDHVSRVHHLERAIAQVGVDLSIARSELDERRIFAEIAPGAEVAGLARQGARHEVPITETPEPIASARADLASDLERGSRLLIAEAVAADAPREPGRARSR